MTSSVTRTSHHSFAQERVEPCTISPSTFFAETQPCNRLMSHELQAKKMLQSAAIECHELPAKNDTDSKPRLPSKRKRDTICGLGRFNKAFTIRPCLESPYDQPITFKPVRIIGRSQLPLSFLDTSADGDLFTNRLFSASIGILEEHHPYNDRANKVQRVLIARLEIKRILYVIERTQANVYSLCKLASWLTEKDVAELWDPESLDCYPRLPKTEHSGSLWGNWWEQAIVAKDSTKRPFNRVRISMMRARKDSEHAVPQAIPSVIDQPIHEQEYVDTLLSGAAPEMVEMPAPPSPQEQLETMVEQYLNAVYLSKTSLAYFAKGPIARIRNAFTSPEEGAPPTHELVTFLRSMLLSHKVEERKYREKLPEVIKSIPPRSFTDDEADVASKVKRSKKKIKRNRDGLYPYEEDTVKKWWAGEVPNMEAYNEETIDQRITRRLADLRVREVLAQMILMLEIIALEALATYKAPPEEADIAEESQAPGESQAKARKRKKKLDDINLQLDLLLDKLCIWQSVEQAGVLDFDTKPSKPDDGASGGNDRLQSFCVEVVVPFYMNRLPEKARTVNKKLGGPTNSSPPKRKAAKPPTTSRKSGEPKEPEAKKSRRTLSRVATETTGQPCQRRVTASLSRSNTDPALIDGIKREGSEVPLSAIPFQRSPSKAARQSMSQFKHLKGREIDLATTSAAAAAKLRQKKRVEEDLKEAITALKKPNRGLAAGGYVDEIEKRGLGPTGKSRKPANTVRKVVKDVLVSATPRVGRRTKDVIGQTPMHHGNPFIRPRGTDVPPSIDFFVPSSAARPVSPTVPTTVGRGVTARTLAASAVTETPSKPPSKKAFLTADASSRTIFATPSKHRSESPDPLPLGVEATPTRQIASSLPNHITISAPLPFATPTKTVIEKVLTPLPRSTSPGNGAAEPSIYDALGWNDDDDCL